MSGNDGNFGLPQPRRQVSQVSLDDTRNYNVLRRGVPREREKKRKREREGGALDAPEIIRGSP